MKWLTMVAALAALVGCARAETIRDTVADAKRDLNDLKVSTWVMQACDLPVGGVQREMPLSLRRGVAEHCKIPELAPEE